MTRIAAITVTLLCLASPALLIICGAPSAQAQKSEDTLRIGMAGSLSGLSTYHDSTPASHFLAPALFDTLVAYDERTNNYQPLLATSWTRTDPRTLEFEIRKDAKWHDGAPVDVDDAVYTLDWLSDAETKLHLQYQFDWIDHVEKLSHTRLRVIAKQPVPYDLARLAMHIPILPEHKHGQLLQERSYFGRSPVGSGPYKFASLDHGQASVARVVAYSYGGNAKPMPKIGRIQVRAGWTYDDRIADWRNGAIDILLDADPQLADSLARERKAVVSVVKSYGMLMLSFDGRAGGNGAKRPLADMRLRKALMLALDRSALAAALPPGGRDSIAPCWPEQAGCGTAPTPMKQDLTQARALLAEIGGTVEIVVSAHGGTAAQVAEIAAKSWRALGIGVRIDDVSAEDLYMRVRDHKLDAAIYPWTAGTMPDVYDTMQQFYAPGFWDLHEDAVLHELANAGDTEMDDAARRGIATRAFAHAAANAYTMPIAPFPALIVHTPDIAVDPRGRFDGAGFNVFDLSWR